MLIEHVTGNRWKEYNQSLVDFESQFSYPSNETGFSISHAPNYKAFFESLRFNVGEPQLFFAKSENQDLVGLIVAVLQKVPFKENFIDTWYLCDFKVSHKYLGFLALLKLLKALKSVCFSICPRAYAISMNPKEGNNRVAVLCERNPFLKLQKACDLNLYEIKNWDTFKGPNQSLVKTSKVILKSGMPLNLWHVANSSAKVLLGESALILYADVNHQNLPLWGTCSIMHYDMEFMDWSWVSSVDI